GESTTLYFEDVNDYVSNLRAIIDAYKETLKGMHITVESLINRRTNKIITVLTVISVGLMPINLFTGFYGMNVANLPFAGNIWLIASLLALLEIGTIMIMLVMRRRRWL
ncbi:MAG: CorA family divalent cation transporter, partial [Bacteroidota bacterium]